MDNLLFGLEQYVLDVGIWGPIAYIGIMVLAIVVSPIPSSPLAIFAGTIFGFWFGALWTMIGATLGAMVAFYLARVFGRPLVVKFVSEKKLREVEERFPEKHLAWGIFISRLFPTPFFDVVSYAAGLTRVSARAFFIATMFGLVPLVFLFTYFGRVFGGNLLGISTVVIFVTLALFVVAGVVYKSKKGKKLIK